MMPTTTARTPKHQQIASIVECAATARRPAEVHDALASLHQGPPRPLQEYRAAAFAFLAALDAIDEEEFEADRQSYLAKFCADQEARSE